MRALGHQVDRGQAARLARPPRIARRQGPRFAADRYSRRVALLKRVLPAIGVALLLLVAAWPRLSPLLDSVRLGFAAIDLREARELKMLNPRYAGIDRFNRPYVVTAAVGRQVPNGNDLMSLERPRAEIVAHGGAKVVLTAATGIYQSQTQLLDLFGDVTMTHQNGSQFVTRRAHADFSDNTAEGHDPIAGHGPSGDIRGQGFRVLDRGDTIIFTGRSHLVLKGSKPGAAAKPPPALPPSVATAAARIEAAATASPVAGPTARATAPVAKPRPAKPAPRHRAAAKPHHRETPAAKSHLAGARTKPEPAAGKVGRDAG
jgi:lipopolysaccharide export system protein LptC